MKVHHARKALSAFCYLSTMVALLVLLGLPEMASAKDSLVGYTIIASNPVKRHKGGGWEGGTDNIYLAKDGSLFVSLHQCDYRILGKCRMRKNDYGRFTRDKDCWHTPHDPGSLICGSYRKSDKNIIISFTAKRDHNQHYNITINLLRNGCSERWSTRVGTKKYEVIKASCKIVKGRHL